MIFHLDERVPHRSLTTGFVSLRGWCLSEQKEPVDDLFVVVNGSPCRVSREWRSDLVEAFPEVGSSGWGGFTAELWLGKGIQFLEIRAGGRRMWKRVFISLGLQKHPWKRIWPLGENYRDGGSRVCEQGVDVVGVFFNRPDSAEDWFSSLADAAAEIPDLRVYVQEHGEVPVVKDLVEKWSDFLSIDWNHNPENPGFGSGCNAGARRGKAPFIFFINPDASLPHNSLRRLLDKATETANDGVVGWEPTQTPWEHPKIYHPVTREVEWSSAAGWLVSRRAFEQVGGFEESLFLYGEDVELSWRLRANGGRLLYVPEAQIIHDSYSEAELQCGKSLQVEEGAKSNAFMRGRFGGVFSLCGAPAVVRRNRGEFRRGRRNRHRSGGKRVSRFHGLQHEVARFGCQVEPAEVLSRNQYPIVFVRVLRSEAGFGQKLIQRQMAGMIGVEVRWEWWSDQISGAPDGWVFDMRDQWLLFPDALIQMIALATRSGAAAVLGHGLLVEGAITSGRWRMDGFFNPLPLKDDPNEAFRPGVLRRESVEAKPLHKSFWLEAVGRVA